MHRHGYKGRKFQREVGPRTALMKGLASELINHSSIETTLPKAKELRPYVEKLVTKAKKGDLHNRRLIITKVATKTSANKLMDEVAPKLSARDSGYLRIERTTNRRGDNTQMARISFVDDLSAEAPVAKAAAKVATPAVKKPVARKAPAKKEAK